MYVIMYIYNIKGEFGYVNYKRYDTAKEFI